MRRSSSPVRIATRPLRLEYLEGRLPLDASGLVAPLATSATAEGEGEEAQVPDFSLLDSNPNSSTYNQNVSPRDFMGQISAWYFAYATCGYCTQQYGRLDEIQQQLNSEHPDLKVQILGVNELGHEIGNLSITAGRTIPWLQDVDADGDGLSDVWSNSWDYEFRDLVIVNAQNVPIDVYNLTENNLVDQSNYDELLQKLINAAQDVSTPLWTNPVEPLDVNNDTFVSPLDALLIINELNELGARELTLPNSGSAPPPYIDPSGDGFLSPMDALLVVNRLNEINAVQSVSAVKASALEELSAATSDSARPSDADSRDYLLAAAVDEIFFGHDDDSSPKRRVLAEAQGATAVGALP